jgi:A/G-specific adenine glycosylase
VRAGCAARRAGGPAPRPARRGAERFEDSDRWARGRILAALLAGEEPPAAVTGARRARALAGLERDGLIVIGPDGSPRLPT